MLADLPDGLLDAIHGVPTPCYVLDPARVRHRAREFATAVRRLAPRATLAYPYKVNPLAEVASIPVDVYGHAEVATAEERELALKHACAPPHCVLGGIAKSEHRLGRAVAEGATVKIDSIAEGASLTSAWRTVEPHERFRVLLRLALPDAGGWSRFGLLPDEATLLLAGSAPWRSRVVGVHFHAGTALATPDLHIAATRHCEPFLRRAARGDLPPVLDIGGGYPNVPDAEVAVTAERFVSAVLDVLADAGWAPTELELVCEPGRITVERAGYLVASILEGTARNGRDAVVVDAGSTLAGGSWAPVRSGRSLLFPAAGETIPSPCDVYGNLSHEDDLVAASALVVAGADASGVHTRGIAVIGDTGGYRLAAAAPWMQMLPAVYQLTDASDDGLGHALALARPTLRLADFA
ncbi:MAG: hypothetical protein ACRDY4_11655 [Acidimicrobiia bacterium]